MTWSKWESAREPDLDEQMRLLNAEEAATVRRVARPRGELNPTQERRLKSSADRRVKAEAEYRAAVVKTLTEGASFSEVAAFTGLSTNTLQRWKREAI